MMFGVEWMATAAQGKGGGLSILWGMGGEATYRLGMSWPYGIYIQHEWYRLITAMFLHGGLIHIGFNMMALMQIGPALEELYGSSRYFFLFIITGAFGFLVSSFPYGLGTRTTHSVPAADYLDSSAHARDNRQTRRLLHARIGVSA